MSVGARVAWVVSLLSRTHDAASIGAACRLLLSISWWRSRSRWRRWLPPRSRGDSPGARLSPAPRASRRRRDRRIARGGNFRRRRLSPSGRTTGGRTTLVSCSGLLCCRGDSFTRDRGLVPLRRSTAVALRHSGGGLGGCRPRGNRHTCRRPLDAPDDAAAQPAARGSRTDLDHGVGPAGVDLRPQGQGGAGELLGHMVCPLPARAADAVRHADAIRRSRARGRLSITRRSRSRRAVPARSSADRNHRMARRTPPTTTRLASSSRSPTCWRATAVSRSAGVADPPSNGWRTRSRRSSKRESSLSRGRFPQLDLVAIRIHDPAELAEFGILRLADHLATFLAQCCEQVVQLLDAVVHHERRGAGLEVVGGCVEQAPRGGAVAIRVVRARPV